MSKPFNQFGGWLIFFLVTIWLSIVLGLVNGPRNIANVLTKETYEHRLIYLILFIDGIVALVLAFRLVMILKIKEANTPERVTRILTWIVLLKTVFGLCEIIVGYLLFGANSLDFISEIANNIFRVLIYWAIWTNYFKKSKRVISYYRRNANLQM
jgi:hypothetical protein